MTQILIDQAPRAARRPTSSRGSESVTARSDSSGAVFQFGAEALGALIDPQSSSGDIHPENVGDKPIRSIEDDSESPSSEQYAMNGTSDNNRPTFSFSCSSSAAQTPETETSNGSFGRCSRSEPPQSVISGLNNMHSSSASAALNLGEISAALDRISSSSRARSTLSPSPGPPGTRRAGSRRRSSPLPKAVVRHEVLDEVPPKDRFHEAGFQQAFAEAKRLMADLADVLGSSTLHKEPDSTMRRLHGDAAALSHPSYPSTRTVGFVGDSGVGKSSLLNSLLDFQGLARTSNSGAACTCVVTEYIYHVQESFKVEVEVFSHGEIMAQVRDLLRSYRHFHNHGDEMEGEERKDSEERAHVANETFRAMFRGRLGDTSFLLQHEEDDALQTLEAWVGECLPSSIIAHQMVSSVAECSNLLAKLTSEQGSSDEPAVWPYISKIKVFLKAHILRNGLILVDLPGLRDLNAARRNITERFLLHCDEIFAVCPIGRATTDVGVMSVFELAEQANLANVGIVCTKSDDIRADEAKRDWRGLPAQTIRRLLDDVKADRQKIEDITTDLNDFDDDEDLLEEDKEEQLKLYQRLREVKKRLTEHEFRLTRFLVTTRNGKVTQSLETLYGPRLPSNNVRVFCVSNVRYWDYRFASRDVALPHLELSGILALRKHCLSIVSEAQFRIAAKYIKADIPALLEDVDLWVQSGAGTMDAQQKAVVRATLDRLESELQRALTGPRSEINKMSKSIKTEFKDEIYNKFRQCSASWSRGARDACCEWSCWHHTTYAAFCRKFGNHYTAAAGAHNWNEEAIEVMTRDLLPRWDRLLGAIVDRHETTTALIEESLDTAKEHLETQLGTESPYTATLQRALLSRRRLLQADVEKICDVFDTDLSTDALSGIRTSMMGQALEESYNECRLDSGSGVDARRKGVMRRKLNDVALFNDLIREFRNRFTALADDLQTDVQVTIKAHLVVVENTLNLIRDENIALESESDEEFRTRVESGLREIKDKMDLILARVPDAEIFRQVANP